MSDRQSNAFGHRCGGVVVSEYRESARLPGGHDGKTQHLRRTVH